MIPREERTAGADGRDPLEETALRQPRIRDENDLAGARSPTQATNDEPVAVAQGRRHAVAAHDDRDERGAHRYFFVAQKMSLISFTAACRSAAAFASTLCLFFEQSLAAFQKVSCRLGCFSRCSGLK